MARCALPDPSPLEERIAAFVSDRCASAVTGPRRMPRSELVGMVRDAVARLGTGAVVLDHWSQMDGDSGDSDVLYGQDLCHQVPAVVRHRPL